VTEKDVRAAASSFLPRVEVRAADSGADAASARRRPEAKQTGRKRAIIAKRLSESFFSAPHYYLRREIRAERLLEARAELNQGRDKPISLNALLMKLAASVLAKHPEMNVYWRGEHRRAKGGGHRRAVSLPDGLITPWLGIAIKRPEEIVRELRR
jgi:pyruvate dehydrogenase E2 component (dihydrolipoamide acetyltransferase)